MESIQQVAAHGGKRAGAGRLPRNVEQWARARGISPACATEILGNAEERRLWYRILSCDDVGIVLRALMYLTDRRDGRPAQQINVTSRNINMSVSDLERARDIIREIRGESPSPNLGLAQGSVQEQHNGETSIMVSGSEGGKKGG